MNLSLGTHVLLWTHSDVTLFLKSTICSSICLRCVYSHLKMSKTITGKITKTKFWFLSAHKSFKGAWSFVSDNQGSCCLSCGVPRLSPCEEVSCHVTHGGRICLFVAAVFTRSDLGINVTYVFSTSDCTSLSEVAAHSRAHDEIGGNVQISNRKKQPHMCWSKESGHPHSQREAARLPVNALLLSLHTGGCDLEEDS